MSWAGGDLMGFELISGNKNDITRPCGTEGVVLFGRAVVLGIRRY